MRILIHAGLGKTGSTSIQKSFYASRDVLLTNGVVYPSLSDRLPHHGMLLPCLFGPGEWRREFGPDTSERRDRLSALSEETWSKLFAAAQSGDLLIISCEHIASLRKATVERLRERLAAISDQQDVLVYYRRPADLYLSKMQQRFKASWEVADPNEYRVRFDLIFKKLNEVFCDRVTIRLFDRGALLDGDVVKDFTHFGARLTDVAAAAITHVNDNKSLSAEGMEILSRFRFVNFTASNGIFNRPSKIVLGAIQSEERKREGFTKPQLKAHIAGLIDHNHRKALLDLRERGLVFSSVNYEALSRAERPLASPTRTFAELVRIDAALERSLALAVLDNLADQVARGQPEAEPTAEKRVNIRSLEGVALISEYCVNARADRTTGISERCRVVAERIEREEMLRQSAGPYSPFDQNALLSDSPIALVIGRLRQDHGIIVASAPKTADKPKAPDPFCVSLPDLLGKLEYSTPALRNMEMRILGKLSGLVPT